MYFHNKLIKLFIILITLSASAVSANIDMDKISYSLYIGESFKSGRVYLENFDIRANKNKFPKKINFIGMNDFKIYSLRFDKRLNKYIGDEEKDTKYFYKPYSRSKSIVALYKTTPMIQQIGIGIYGYEIESIDKSKSRHKRKYTKEEYDYAMKTLKEDKEIKEEDRSLSYMTIENTLIGAKEHFRIKLKNNIELVVSEYFTLGIEYAGEVYIIEVFSNNKKIGSLPYKLNLEGPY